MKRIEKDEIQRLPERYRPLGAWKLFWLNVLYSIPILGQVFWIIHCFSGKNINRRCFARHYFITFLMGVIISGIAIALLVLVFGYSLDAITKAIPSNVG